MFLRESLLAESGGGTASHTTKQTQLNFRAPQPSVFEGCEFRRGVAQAASSKLNLACWAGKAGPRGNNAIPRRENQKPRKNQMPRNRRAPSFPKCGKDGASGSCFSICDESAAGCVTARLLVGY